MLAPFRPLGAGDADALVGLVDDGAERAQRVQVEVDRAVADAAPTEVGDERLAEAVQQRPAEQDRDAAGAGVRVDLLEVRRRSTPLGSRSSSPSSAPSSTETPCTLEHASGRPATSLMLRARRAAVLGGLAQQGRDHRLGDEVLGALAPRRARSGSPASDRQDFTSPARPRDRRTGRNAETDFIRWTSLVSSRVALWGIAHPGGARVLAMRTGSVRGRHASRRAFELRDLVFVAQREPDVVGAPREAATRCNRRCRKRPRR